MSSETFVTGVPIAYGFALRERVRRSVGARVRWYAATQPQAGHLEALVNVERDGKLKVVMSEATPHTANAYDPTKGLQAYLDELPLS